MDRQVLLPAELHFLFFPTFFGVKVILGDVFNATVDRVNHSISREMVLTDDTDVHEGME